MFISLLNNENTKIFRRPMLWVMLTIMALLMVCFLGGIYGLIQFELFNGGASSESLEGFREIITWPGALTNSLGFAGGNQLGGLLLVILVGAVTAQEYGWRTMQLWLSRGVSRPMLLIAKLASLILPAALIVLVTALASGLISGVFSLLFDGRLPVEKVDFLGWGLSVLRVTYTLLPYAALSFLLAIAFRSPVIAIGGSLAYTLLFEGFAIQLLNFVGGKLALIGQYLPGGMASSLIALNQAGRVNIEVAGRAVEQAYLAPGPAAIGIALWTLLFSGLALWVFIRQDLSQ